MNLYLSNLNEINQPKLFLINIILNIIAIDLKHMSGLHKIIPWLPTNLKVNTTSMDNTHTLPHKRRIIKKM
jgi:hypothetical protein